jgi:putative transcriptional regulator
MNSLTTENKNTNFESLAGKFLISSPYAFGNDVFNKSLIYVMSHNETGALGLIVNRMVNKLPAGAVLKLFKDNGNESELSMPVYVGGPVEPERGFVLHTSEYTKNLLLQSSDNLAVSSNIEIIRDIAHGQGPQHSMVVLGYTGWSPDQLESEIEKNMWIISNSSNEIIFSDSTNKWDTALSKMGIDNASFSPHAGHC